LSPTREKFATQVSTDILAAVREIARVEGRQIQSLVDEAFADLVEKHKSGRPRPRAIAGYLSSVEKYSALYQKLAE
jgi:hypothetical protein